MVIQLVDIAAQAFTENERPIHRRVWYLLRIYRWRNQYRVAQETRDYEMLERLDWQYEFISSI